MRTLFWALMTGALVMGACAERIPASEPMPGEGTLHVPQWEEFCKRHPQDHACSS